MEMDQKERALGGWGVARVCACVCARVCVCVRMCVCLNAMFKQQGIKHRLLAIACMCMYACMRVYARMFKQQVCKNYTPD